MKNRQFQFHYPSLAMLLLLGACSGGDVSVSIDGPAIPPLPVQASEAITTHGAITGLGNITVNDVRYAAMAATVTINGEPGTLADLRRGQIVTLSGTINTIGQTGTASSIRYEANLIGPVETLDAATSRLTVMGQSVLIDADTLFDAAIDPVTFAGLSIGDIVQISGHPDATGAIRASRIDPDAANAELRLIGKVTGLDIGNLLFTINRLTVDYSGAIVIDLPGGAPVDGMTVQVIGTQTGGLFVVERIVAAPDLVGISGRRMQTAGVITRFDSQSAFYINDTPATIDAGTIFSGGDAGDLALNAQLVIDGTFASNGRIEANRVTFGRLMGNSVTLTFGLSDFNKISVPGIFNVTATQGAAFSVEVIVDEEHQNRVDVTRTGDTLNIVLTSGDGNIDTLEAFVTMPVIDSIDLSGVVNATLNDFSQSELTVNVSGVSRLIGNRLTIGNLTASISGVSQLDFGGIRPLAGANIDIGGVSTATLNMDVGTTLGGTVSTGQGTGVSALFYYGTDVTVDVTTGFGSVVERLGDTRP